ncbi:tetratricopeptide repeat protein [Qipengyuania marisflavi]|uniref:Tetratricopeptide repeat protein n=1 Tax=Qipengyuania marisflavi TaxID=2486356 RepID=A0A5S3PCS5_9SPHN|nr:tetratricopeptide repeat protein [Qipengyuania marisflavi]TMM49059.1 tetratricopeptide repeat protein [Qipengyuania marisflavi]
MNWIAILALAALAFLLAATVLRLPRGGWMLFGAALLFGLAGYALQGSPGQPSSPAAAKGEAPVEGELLVEARREFFASPQPPSRFVTTADAFARRGDFENAANFLRNAVRENPNDAEAWLALGNALVEHADGQLTASALFAYSRAEDTAPGNPAPTYFYGLALLRAGQAVQARGLWAEALEQAPQDAAWRPGLAERLERLDALIVQMSPGSADSPAR